MQRALVVSSDKQQLMPCHPARARQLLKQGKAAVYRRYPFTIIMKNRASGDRQPVQLKLDPGSKVTGVALVAEFAKRGKVVVFSMELQHRGQAIKDDLMSRRAIRRGRRTRKTRYRAARFDNRRRPQGWLPPSLMHRVSTTMTWVNRLRKFVPITGLSMGLVRFDTQAMQSPEVSGLEYQRGTLFGYEVKEYLLLKWGHRCCYCDCADKPLEVEHIVARSNGGSDRVSNLCLACEKCNQKKGSRPVKEFLAKQPERLKRILAHAKAPLKDAAAVNATRWALFERLNGTGLLIEVGTGGRTKFNRIQQGYPKAHWIDAACVGESGASVRLDEEIAYLHVKCVGHGSRQMCRVNRFGFPRTAAKSVSVVDGFRTGDMARLDRMSGKYKGTYIGTVSVRASRMFDIKTTLAGRTLKITAQSCQFTKLHGCDGYAYA